jgi:hypothetical protein
VTIGHSKVKRKSGVRRVAEKHQTARDRGGVLLADPGAATLFHDKRFRQHDRFFGP